MKVSLKRFLHSLSFCLDFVEIDVLGATTNHSRRVAYISLRLAEHLGLSENERFELFTYAIMHDNGLSEETVFSKLDAKELEEFDFIEHSSEHCEIGERNIRALAFVESKNIVKYHHEFYDGSGFYRLKGEDIPLMAQIICLADYTDNLLHFEIPSRENRNRIISFIREQRGKYFSGNMVDIFLEISKQPSFWLDLQIPFLFSALDEIAPEKYYTFSHSELLNFTKIISRIIDCKSKFTMRHSSGLSEKTAFMYDYYNFDNEKKIKAVVAANLHDLGKLAIPNSILDKPSKLTDEERDTVKQHTYYTRAALKEIGGFEEITEWASNHHERLDGSGYPYGLKGKQLDFTSRLLGCLDIYQALTEERPYRKPLKHSGAMKILYSLANLGKIDPGITKDIDKALR